MKEILFVTGNERKLGEACVACQDFDITVKQVKLAIDEIQAHDPIEIAKHKANEAFRQVESEVVVTDTSWSIAGLNGFPGGYMKDVVEWFTPEDFIGLIVSKKDKRVSFTETIIYKSGSQTKIFSQEYFGEIVTAPRGSGNSIEQVAEFDGFTLGERHDQGRFSHNPKDYIWYRFAEWYTGRRPAANK